MDTSAFGGWRTSPGQHVDRAAKSCMRRRRAERGRPDGLCALQRAPARALDALVNPRVDALGWAARGKLALEPCPVRMWTLPGPAVRA